MNNPEHNNCVVVSCRVDSMAHNFLLAVLPFLAFCMNPVRALAGELDIPHHPSRLIVRFQPGSVASAKEQIHAAVAGAESVWTSSVTDGLEIVSVPEGQLQAALLTYRQQAGVLYVTPDYELLLDDIPNDTEFGKQWALQNVGQTVDGDAGSYDADIDAPLAWQLETGAADCVIAVVDSGVDYRHQDLLGRIWTNPVECPNGICISNGIDDDGNGYVDDFHGWDVGQIPGDNDPIPHTTNANSSLNASHGTRVAGVIAATANNYEGVIGVAHSCKILPIKIGDEAGANIGIGTALMALDYLIDNVPRYNIRLSIHTYSSLDWRLNCLGAFPQDLYDKFAALHNTELHIAVVSAGNYRQQDCRNRWDNDETPVFPANFGVSAHYDYLNLNVVGIDSVISVAMTKSNDQIDGNSRYGLRTVQLGAPGINIYTTAFTAGSTRVYNYAFSDGTSFAAPHVAGVMALTWSRFPSWTAQQVRDKVLSTVRPVSSLATNTCTGGIVNAYRAVMADCNDNGESDDCDINCNAEGCSSVSCGQSSDCNNFESDCCGVHSAPGCDDASIQSAVCSYEPDCCSVAWSTACVTFAMGEYEALYGLGNTPCETGADGIPDECQPAPDTDGDSVTDPCELVCAPGCGLPCGEEEDCDGNCVPDTDQMASCYGATPGCSDCNGNGRLDGCDILDGTSCDGDGNSMPDECGACCVSESECVLRIDALCQGVFQLGRTCTECDCSSGAGKCCLGSTCSATLLKCECELQGGNWLIDLYGTGCAGSPCATGVCCDPTSSSMPCFAGGTPQQCSGIHARFIGGATTCGENNSTCAEPSGPVAPALAEPNGVRKNRVISFVPTTCPDAGPTAIRVRLKDLPEGMPGEGTFRWVSVPDVFDDYGPVAPDEFAAAKLVCNKPEQTIEWDGSGVLHVYGDAIIPDAMYEVQMEVDGLFSSALEVSTARWGDVVPSCCVDFEDVTALVNKFVNSSSVPLVRTKLQPSVPDLTRSSDFADISKVLDAFRGVSYRYAVSSCQ